MPKCPKCGAEIDHIDWMQPREVHDLLRADGCVEWKDDYDDHSKPDRYECPECDQQIANSYEEALAILNETEEKADGSGG